MASEPDGSPDAMAVVSDVLADPGSEAGRLPQLLGLLDRDDPETRLCAAFGITLIANADPEMVEPITRRLVDRLADESETPETVHALGYLRDRYPDTVGETLREIARETREREGQRRRHEISRGFARDDGRPSFDRGVGRTRFPGEGTDQDPQRLYRREGEKVGGAPAEARDDEVPEEDPGIQIPAQEQGDPDEVDKIRERNARLARLERAEARIGLEDLVMRSRFEDLAVLALPSEGRYTDVYRARALMSGSEQGIALHTFRLPEENREQFETDICEALESWQAVADDEFVVTLYDWGRQPRLWMATEYTDMTLYDRIDMGLSEAIWNGVQVAETVASAHEQGVVHTGIDPYNVVYTDNTIRSRQQPLVANFALLDVLRMYGEPSTYLDPRYAAPEYFERRYGQVDHATDIYQLGAILYKLGTGTAPFDGSYDEVRTGVLEATPPAPSEINPEIPTWFDGIVRKAMAKQKLTRYETATQLVQELRAEVGDGEL